MSWQRFETGSLRLFSGFLKRSPDHLPALKHLMIAAGDASKVRLTHNTTGGLTMAHGNLPYLLLYGLFIFIFALILLRMKEKLKAEEKQRKRGRRGRRLQRQPRL